MNAMSFLRTTETIGAREFRQNLDRYLHHPKRACRIMLHNKPALAVMPDEDFLQILEILEELKDEGLLDRVTKKLAAEHRNKQAWFWTRAWQAKEDEADAQIKAGKTRRAHSADELIKQFKTA